MCKFKLFSIAAAALMMVACSTDDLTQQTQIKTGEMQFTATIAAPSGTTRTTYEQDGDNINVKWVVGDEIALVHNKVKDVAKVKSISSDGTSATIEGIITGSPKDEDPIQLFYPAALISGVTSDGNPVFDNDVSANMNKQDGTLEFIQKNLDFRNSRGLLSVNGSEATLKEAAKMYAMIAIWKLKLKDNASALLEASKVSIEMGSGDYRSGASATPSSPKSELTIATTVAPAVDNVRPITIEATVGNDTYVYSQDNVDVTPGKYYQSTVAFGKPVATVTTAPTASSETIYPQSTKALVNAGVAKNGTMMYRLTTSNTKPETAGDFSEDVPTAAGILNAGTYYVWYYAKGDDTHADSEIAGPVEITVAKPAATVTTAPTAKTGVKAGENAAIINAGVTSDGTMMYAVTTTNTKPTTTDGFSATVPTAQSLAAGTCYVWYYVKGDATHADSDIAGSVSVTIAEAGISTKDASETFTPTANTVTGTYFKVSGIKMDNVWEIGGAWQNTITISSPDGLNLSQVVFTVGNQANISQRNPSHLNVNHGTLTVTGTTPGNTVTISNIDSPSVTLSLPGSTNNAAKWTFTQTVVNGKGDASK